MPAGRLVALFDSPNYCLPLLPAAALVEVLGTDPLLMGRVMVAAQSPAHGGTGNVRSLQEAVQRLGIRGLRNIVLAAAAEMRVFRTPTDTEQMESVRRHSLVTARRPSPASGSPSTAPTVSAGAPSCGIGGSRRSSARP